MRSLRHPWLAGGCLGVVLATSAGAAARSPSCEGAERVVLENGVEVLLVAEPATPTLAVVSSVHVGTRNDPPGYEGLAHFVQHLTSLEATGFASSMALYRQAGAFELNSATNPDTTDYYALLPAAQLERALWIEARRLAMGLDALDEAAAVQERERLRREDEWRFGNGPGHLLLQTVETSLFAPRHPYHAPPENEHSLRRTTLADARAFFSRHYRPDRVRLVLLGGFEMAQAKLLLERHLSSLPTVAGGADGLALAQRDCAAVRATPATPASQRLLLSSQRRHEAVEFYWPLAPDEDGQRWRGMLTVFANVLSDAAREAGLSHDVQMRLEQRELGGFWKLELGLVPGRDPALAEPLVRQIWQELRKNTPDPGTLTAWRQRFELSEALLRESLLRRARGLARRECSTSICVPGSERVELSPFSELERFAPERALMIERRFDPRSPIRGSIERVE
jgi:zinc protease